MLNNGNDNNTFLPEACAARSTRWKCLVALKVRTRMAIYDDIYHNGIRIFFSFFHVTELAISVDLNYRDK